MAIEGLDAAVLIEGSGFTPQIAVPEEDESAPTVQAALKEAGRHAERAAVRDAAAHDLWVTDAMRSVDRIAHLPTPLAVAAVPDEAADDTDAGRDHPLVKEKLSFAEMGHMIARQYDSTDYSWDEMSSGDYEWAVTNFRNDVYAAVQQATAEATSLFQAEQLAQAYLISVGLGAFVHVGNPSSISDDAIVVTGYTYHQPNTLMPSLWMDDTNFQFVDPGSTYESLDLSAITISLEIDRPLTPQEQVALERLSLQIKLTTAMLNSLPANGVFTFADGRTITVAELRALWARADFIITEQNYAALGSPSRPGSGAAHRNDGDPLFEVNINDLTNVFMPMDWNRTLYPLHELAHVTLAGYATTVAMYTDNVRTDHEYDMNEAFATSLGIAIGQAAGYSWLPLFLNDAPQVEAFQLVPLPTFSAPEGGNGGGGGESGGGGGQVGEQ